MTIDGSGQTVAISGNDAVRVFYVEYNGQSDAGHAHDRKRSDRTTEH